MTFNHHWTTAELDAEYKYVKIERLGMMCEDRTPTPEQEHLAHVEAITHTKKLRASTSGIQQLINLGESL